MDSKKGEEERGREVFRVLGAVGDGYRYVVAGGGADIGLGLDTDAEGPAWRVTNVPPYMAQTAPRSVQA